jgi:hypothetical protein
VNHLQRFDSVGGLLDQVSFLLQANPDGHPDVRVIVDNQNLRSPHKTL